MLSLNLGLIFSVCLCARLTSSAPPQAPITMGAVRKQPHKLHGRFLHLTDVHIDPYYVQGTSQFKACHRGSRKKKKKPLAGYYGTPFGDCDSPFKLSNFTFDFLDEHWASEVDFVIWTGDTARHGNDPRIPRTSHEINELNRVAADRMYEIFTRRGIPVVPSIGNNDVSPHNFMKAGPNEITSDFASIWQNFIPSQSHQTFLRGGYYSVEVIPDAVAVIALNTLYFFDSNEAVQGCKRSDAKDPGNLEFEWLEAQLDGFRGRNMQVWISGHIPPTAGNYFPGCLARYTKLSLRYQDTILGHLYGHMNNDHFFFIDANSPRLSDPGTLSNDSKLFDNLLSDFAELDEEINEDEYAVVNVAPSVVPIYLPSFRVFLYNVTGSALRTTKRLPGSRSGSEDAECEQEKGWEEDYRSSDGRSPSRYNTLWSPIGYAQYYMPNLGSADEPPEYGLEYLTFPPRLLHPPRAGSPDERFRYPLPLKNLPKSLRKGPIKTSKYAPYHLRDLTIGSWIGLAKRLARDDEKELRKKFKRYIAVKGGY